MVSEDSDQDAPRLPVVHRLGNPSDLDETARGSMFPRSHDRHAPPEGVEVVALRGPQRVRFEERDDRVKQITPLSNLELHEVLTMVVAAPIDVDPPNPEELLELLETGRAPRALRHHKVVGHLVARSIATPASPIGLLGEADGEASFPIHEADYPSSSDQPFLLVFRTGRTVTAHD